MVHVGYCWRIRIRVEHWLVWRAVPVVDPPFAPLIVHGWQHSCMIWDCNGENNGMTELIFASEYDIHG